MKVGEVMNRQVELARPGDRLAVAAQRMLSSGIRHLPVVGERGALVGVLSETDVLRFRRQRASRAAPEATVEMAMSAWPVTIAPDDEASEAAHKMLAHGVHCLPVVQAGVLRGILTASDLLEAELAEERRRRCEGPGPEVSGRG